MSCLNDNPIKSKKDHLIYKTAYNNINTYRTKLNDQGPDKVNQENYIKFQNCKLESPECKYTFQKYGSNYQPFKTFLENKTHSPKRCRYRNIYCYEPSRVKLLNVNTWREEGMKSRRGGITNAQIIKDSKRKERSQSFASDSTSPVLSARQKDRLLSRNSSIDSTNMATRLVSKIFGNFRTQKPEPRSRTHSNLTHDQIDQIIEDNSIFLNNPHNSAIQNLTNDFIHANYVRGRHNNKNFSFQDNYYIATQGPTAKTVPHFWEMVIDQRVSSIIMVTGFKEGQTYNKINKCEEYVPLEENLGQDNLNQIILNCQSGQEMTFKEDTIIVKLVKTIHKQEYKTREKNQLDLDQSIKQPGHLFTISRISVTRRNPSIPERDINQFYVNHCWYQKWPDKGCPKNPEDLLNFIETVNKYDELLLQERDARETKIITNNIITNNEFDNNNKSNFYWTRDFHMYSSPKIVHCSAGIGRTGTYIVIDQCINAFNYYKDKFAFENEDNKNYSEEELVKKLSLDKKAKEIKHSEVLNEFIYNKDNLPEFGQDIIFEMARYVRHHRVMTIQNFEQYNFCHKAFELYINREKNKMLKILSNYEKSEKDP